LDFEIPAGAGESPAGAFLAPLSSS
jgi:hypothetical protein